MKTHNHFAIVVFTIIGIAALTGALFCGAHHQFVTAILCLLMVIASVIDNIKEKRTWEQEKKL